MTRHLRNAFVVVAIVALLVPPAVFAKDRPRLPMTALPDGLGVNIHFTDARPGEMQMLADAGFRWVRMDFTWAATEREKGVYDFAAYERLLKDLEGHDLRALLILDYGNALYDVPDGASPATDESRQAMARWAAAAASHFKGRGVVWEMWNEPNIRQFWKPQPNVEDYAKLAIEVSKAIRAAAPGELCVGPATSRIDMAFLEGCFKAGLLEHWDALTVHPYRKDAPESVIEEYCKLRELIARHAPRGKHVPILSGEWGYSAAWEGFDADRQGKMLARQWLTNVSQGIGLSIWYDWHDDGPDAREPEHNFGTVRHPYHDGRDPVYDPKPAYDAARTLTRQLRGFRFNKRLALGDSADDFVLLFDKADGTGAVRLVAWTTAKEPKELNVPASAGEFEAVDHVGRKLPPTSAGATGLPLKLTDAPQYLTPTKPNDLLRAAAAWERLPDEVRQPADGPARVMSRFTNPLDRALRIEAGGLRFDMTAGARSIIATLLPAQSADDVAVRIEWTFAGLGAVAQETRVRLTNPLRVTVLPADGRTVMLRIENPSGVARRGRAVLEDAKPKPSAEPVVRWRFADGQTDQLLRVPFAADPLAGYAFGVRVEHDGNGPLPLHFPARRWRMIDRFDVSNAPSWRLTVGGDELVASDASLRSELPPEGAAAEGLGALAISYRFAEGWKYLELKPASDALAKMDDDRPRELGMWLWGDGQGNIPRMRFVDSTGQTFQPTLAPITWTGWRFITFPLDATGSHWGGAADGVIHYPIALGSLLLIDSTDGRKTAGKVYVSGPTLEY